MRTRPLGASGLSVSVLGLGCLHLGTLLDEAEGTRMIHRSLDEGVTFFETAPLYGQGRSEGLLGKALKGRRAKVILSTKAGLEPWTDPEGQFRVRVHPLDADRLRTSLEASLQALGTDHVDLFQLHAWDPSTPFEETLDALEALKREGKLRAYGCSNYGGPAFRSAHSILRARGLAFAAFQVHYNLLERRAEAEVLDGVREAGCAVICNRVLARGVLGGQYIPSRTFPQGSRAASSPRIRASLERFDLGLVAELQAWAAGRGRSVAQLAIAWLLARPGVGCALVGLRSEAQLREAIQAEAWDLDPREGEEAEDLLRRRGAMDTIREQPETLFET